MTTEQNVHVLDCDNCGTTGDVVRDRDLPDGWLAVWRDQQQEGAFCSRACLAQWAAAQHPTSAELTATAREAFKKQTGG